MSKLTSLISVLLVFADFVIFMISAQANTNGNPTISGTFTIAQTDCSTFLGTTLVEILCPLPTQAGSMGFCDSHCRCIHRAKWGYCEKRPQDAPAGTGLSDQWCRCSYDNPPEGWAPNLGDTILCPLWQLSLICPLIQANDTAGGCSSDCICSHGFKNGYCNRERYCICTDDKTVNPIYAYNGLEGYVNQIVGTG